MVYRLIAGCVVLFWLTMTALLLRNEIKPRDSALREVPVGHVVKLLFHHQQPSDLNIISDKLRLGSLRIAPESHKEAGLKVITFSGYLQIAVPGARRQRVAWDGVLELEKSLATRRFRIGVKVHEPETLLSEIEILPAQNLARFQLSSASSVLERQEVSLDARGMRDVFSQLGLDPSLLAALPDARANPPVIKAQQSTLEVHGESMDTYCITIESNGQTWLECHVNQLGQIVRATTLLGYSLVPDDLSP